MYRSVNTAAAHQARIRRVDDRICVFFREVTDHYDHFAVEKSR
jgi:hypothetical protein